MTFELLLLATTAPLDALPTATAPSTTFTTLLSALVAGFVAIVVMVGSHVLTQSRAHQDWVREQQFDAVRRLKTAYRNFRLGYYEAIGRKITSYGVMEWRIPPKDRDWTDVDAAPGEYHDALNDLDMLAMDVWVQKHSRYTRAAMREAHAYLRWARANISDNGILPGDKGEKATKAFEEFGARHLSLLDMIQHRHFTTWFTRWVFRRQQHQHRQMRAELDNDTNRRGEKYRRAKDGQD